jgi:hypothetical protein
MFGINLRSARLTVAAACTVVAMGLAAGSAMAWTPSGTTTGSANSLAIDISAGGWGISCDADLDLTLSSGAANGGSVDAATFSNCVGTGAGTGCSLTATPQTSPPLGASTVPWGIVGDAWSSTVTVDDVDVTFAFGPSCPFTGSYYEVAGSLSGSYDASGTLSFSYAPGLRIVNSNNPAYIGAPAAVTGDIGIAAIGGGIPQLD